MCTVLNPRTLPEIEAALGRNHLAEYEAESVGYDLADILLEREMLYREREARKRIEPDADPEIGYADPPPALCDPMVERMAELRLILLRARKRICADCDASQDIDNAIAECAAIRSEIGREVA